MTTVTHIATNIIEKLATILQTLGGWCMFVLFFVLDFFGGSGFIVFLVVAVTIMDAVWGIAVSIKRGKFTLSELARLTIAKLAVYGCAMFVFVGLGKITDSNLASSFVGAAIVLVEFWSSCGSMLILFPNFLFLRLLRRALTGEIASKLHISEDEVAEVLGETLKSKFNDKDENQPERAYDD